MAMSKKIGIGMLGAGSMGQRVHLPNVLADERCEVVALADARRKLAEQVAAQHGIETVYTSHQDLIADDRVRAIIAIAPEAYNTRVAIATLETGKPVFLEKPMSNASEHAERMVAAAEQSGAVLMIGYMKRYDPGVLQAKAIIDELRADQRLGELIFVRVSCFGGDWQCGLVEALTSDEPYPETYATLPPTWLPEELLGPFQTFNNVYCHNLNLVRFLLEADLAVLHTDVSHPVFLVELEDDGCPVSLQAGLSASHYWDEQTKLYFERGWMEIVTPSPLLRNVPAQVSVYEHGETPRTWQPAARWSWAFREEMVHFVDCLEGKAECRSSGADSIQDLYLVEEIFRQ